MVVASRLCFRSAFGVCLSYVWRALARLVLVESGEFFPFCFVIIAQFMYYLTHSHSVAANVVQFDCVEVCACVYVIFVIARTLPQMFFIICFSFFSKILYSKLIYSNVTVCANIGALVKRVCKWVHCVCINQKHTHICARKTTHTRGQLYSIMIPLLRFVCASAFLGSYLNVPFLYFIWFAVIVIWFPLCHSHFLFLCMRLFWLECFTASIESSYLVVCDFFLSDQQDSPHIHAHKGRSMLFNAI